VTRAGLSLQTDRALHVVNASISKMHNAMLAFCCAAAHNYSGALYIWCCAPQYCCTACIKNHSADHCLAVFLLTYAGSAAQPSQDNIRSDAREHGLSGSKENDGTTCSHSIPAVHLPEAQAQQAARMPISSPPRATTHVTVQDHDHSKCEKLMQSGHQAGSDSVLSPSQYLVKECR